MKRIIFLIGVFIIWAVSNLLAQWPKDLSVNLPICTQSNDQTDPIVISDSDGGAIILWSDKRNGNLDLFAQRVSCDGLILWQNDGVPVYEGRGDQNEYMIVPNGRGGAYITWKSNYHVYAQQIDSDGSTIWNSPLLLTGETIAQADYDIVSDNNKGFIAVWHTSENWSNLKGQRINNNGDLLWGESGATVSDPWTDESISPKIVATSSGGAVVSFQKGWVGYGIYVNILNNNGNRLLSEDVLIDIKDFYGFNDPGIASDGSDGAIITWERDYEIYSNRISKAGLKMWGENGIHVCQAATKKRGSKITCNRKGNAIVVWMDYENNNSVNEIYSQQIDSSGKYIWSADGVLLSKNNRYDSYIRLQNDGLGGAIITWETTKTLERMHYLYWPPHDSSEYVSVQHIDNDGNVTWPEGLRISTDPAQKYSIYAIGDGSDGIIAAWVDKRNGNADIYAQRVDKNTNTYVEHIETEKLHTFNLYQNYPNPFNPITTIQYDIPMDSHVELRILNISGQMVNTLVSEYKPTGTHRICWNGTNVDGNKVPSGIYFFQIKVGDFISTRRMLLIK